MLRQPRPGPIIVTGEPTAGRTRLLIQALTHIEAGDAPVVVGELTRDGAPQRGPARADLRTVPTDPVAVVRVGRAIATAGRRPVFVLDDAHDADLAVVEALRDLHRDCGAVVLASRTTGAAGPDPLDCLWYEAGVRFLSLDPLSAAEVRSILNSQVGGLVHTATAAALHAATGGNPGLLHTLMHTDGLAADLLPREGTWRLTAGPARPLRLSGPVRDRLRSALHQAWAGLALDHVVELGRLAVRAGLAAETVPMLAFALLARGEPDTGLRLLGSDTGRHGLETGPYQDIGPRPDRGTYGPRLDGGPNRSPRDVPDPVLTRALLLAYGPGGVDQAEALLARAAATGGDHGRCLLAARAWILAEVGRTDAAIEALGNISVVGDQPAAAFAHGAAAAIHLSQDRPRRAVSQLRRAIIVAGTVRTELPWLAPYLCGALADALLFAGRISEATAVAADLHRAHDGRGWDVTVSLSALIRAAADNTADRRTAEPRHSTASLLAVGFSSTASPAAGGSSRNSPGPGAVHRVPPRHNPVNDG
jgi:hypothetical protein